MAEKKTKQKLAPSKQNDKIYLVYMAVSLLVVAMLFLLPKEGFVSDYARYLIIGISQTAVVAFAAVMGILAVRKFTLQSAMGWGIFLISLGVASWAIANTIWTVYTLVGVDMPYPSVADIFYVGIIPLTLAGVYTLFRSFGFKLDLKTTLKYAILPVIVGSGIFYIFVIDKMFEKVGLLMKALNITYPLGDVLFVSFALFVLAATKGSAMFKPTAILLGGYLVFSIADLGFVLTTSLGTYYTGCWVTGLFTLGFAIVGAGLYSFKEVFD
ncbi:MAG: hypothetical protein V1820_00065 [archaeon]